MRTRNPLRFIALVSLLSIIWDFYRYFVTAHVDWLSLSGTTLAICFLIGYVRGRRWAWLVGFLIFGVAVPLNLLSFSLANRTQIRSMIGLWFAVAFCVAFAIYVVVLRQHYYTYIRTLDKEGVTITEHESL